MRAVRRRQRLHADRHVSGGACVGSNPVVCAAQRPVPRRREPATRRPVRCSNPAKAEWQRVQRRQALHEDGDTCQSGLCAPGSRQLRTRMTEGLVFSDATTLSWPSFPARLAYDVIREPCRCSAGGAFSAATDACIGNAHPGTSTSDTHIPAVGDAEWYLIRADDACGTRTYDNRATDAGRFARSGIAASPTPVPDRHRPGALERPPVARTASRSVCRSCETDGRRDDRIGTRLRSPSSAAPASAPTALTPPRPRVDRRGGNEDEPRCRSDFVPDPVDSMRIFIAEHLARTDRPAAENPRARARRAAQGGTHRPALSGGNDGVHPRAPVRRPVTPDLDTVPIDVEEGAVSSSRTVPTPTGRPSEKRRRERDRDSSPFHGADSSSGSRVRHLRRSSRSEQPSRHPLP